MSLDLAFGIARSGLQSTQRQLAQASQNIANAGTAGYTRKTLPTEALLAGDRPMGLRTGEAQRLVDATLLTERDARTADAAGAGLRERLLTGIEAAHGRPEAGESLGDAVAKLNSGFLALRASPADTGLQRAALAAAGEVAGRFNAVASAVGRARAEAQDVAGQEVAKLNGGLRRLADLTARIVADRSTGLSTAGLEDERDLTISRLSESLPLRALHKADGNMMLIAGGGLTLPLDARRDVLTLAPTQIGPSAFHGPGGSLPPLLLEGQDVTRQLSGGRLGEALPLRDTTLPRFQAELDVAAAALASRMDGQGLRLFTNASGQVPDMALAYADPASRQLGFSGAMRVNAAVALNPGLLRDGTQAVAGAPGGPTAFTPNAAGGPAGFTTLLDRIVTHALGETVRPGMDWPALPNAGLGPDGTLASPFLAPRSLEGFAAALTGAHTADRAAATVAREGAEGMRRGLDARLQKQSGVDPDTEIAAMMQLQNAYAANARVLNAAQQMWDQLLAAVR